MKKTLLIITNSLVLTVSAYSQSFANYLPSPELAKLNGTWVGSHNGYNLKIVLKSTKRYIKDVNFTGDFLEGNFAYSRSDLSSLKVDTTVQTITDGHFTSQETKDVVVLQFVDSKKNNKKGKIVFSPFSGSTNVYQMNLFNRKILFKTPAFDSTFSIPTNILLKKVD
jgi:hypothetical protein